MFLSIYNYRTYWFFCCLQISCVPRPLKSSAQSKRNNKVISLFSTTDIVKINSVLQILKRERGNCGEQQKKKTRSSVEREGGRLEKKKNTSPLTKPNPETPLKLAFRRVLKRNETLICWKDFLCTCFSDPHRAVLACHSSVSSQ